MKVMKKSCYLILTCQRGEEKTIASHLLEKKLIVCAKFIPVESMYWWQGEITSDNEILILMETYEDLFTKIEEQVATLHSYDTFVLQQISVNRINDKARRWMQDNLKGSL
jgi:periplasmic divalent cation tolerance protein